MDRDELRESTHALINELSNRQLEAVLGILRCLAGRDESEGLSETQSGEGLPPEDLFQKFFS